MGIWVLGSGLLAVLTLWRIVRVMHGIFEVADESFQSEIDKIEARVHELEQQHDMDKKEMSELQSKLTHVGS